MAHGHAPEKAGRDVVEKDSTAHSGFCRECGIENFLGREDVSGKKVSEIGAADGRGGRGSESGAGNPFFKNESEGATLAGSIEHEPEGNTGGIFAGICRKGGPGPGDPFDHIC